MPLDQDTLTVALQAAFPNVPVTSEWAALSGERNTYSPRVDIAVGPYATDRRYGTIYDVLTESNQPLLHALHENFCDNVRNLDPGDEVPPLPEMCSLNWNARCFMAIELDASGSRKHLMGGAVNAAALGRLGMSVACDDENLKALLTVRRYLRFLADVGKNTFDTRNLMILTVSQLGGVLGVE